MMQANWSLILNVLLLIGVIVTIVRLMNARKQSLSSKQYQPNPNQVEKSAYDAAAYSDDIIAVRKVDRELLWDNDAALAPKSQSSTHQASEELRPQLLVSEGLNESKIKQEDTAKKDLSSSTVMMFLLAKENRQFAGYELLQTVLAAGLRFGEGHLFHRHQFSNGQGPVICSLAAATATGVFDLHNIGAFSVRGLCLFMHASKNPSVDGERFSIMLETARQLSEGMDAYLLDDQRKALTSERITRYHRLLRIEQHDEVYATA